MRSFLPVYSHEHLRTKFYKGPRLEIDNRDAGLEASGLDAGFEPGGRGAGLTPCDRTARVQPVAGHQSAGRGQDSQSAG